MGNVLSALQSFRKVAIDHGDQQWDAGEIKQAAALARGDGDQFTTAGKSFLTCELHGKTEFAPGAKQSLADVLLAAPDTTRRHEAVLAVQEGGSNKFYALAVEGSSLITHWGPIGKEGQSKTESFGSPGDADKAFIKTLRGKLAKGYAPADPAAIGLSEVAPAAAAAAKKTGGLDTLASFLALPVEAQDGMLDWSSSAEAAGLTVLESAIADISDPKQRAFAEALRSAASDATGGFEIHDDEYLVVGDPQVSVELYLLPNGDVAGGQVRAFQQGVEQPEDYWDNEDAYDDAKLKALADATDVSWSASGTYANTKSGELRAISEPDYMEWSGY